MTTTAVEPPATTGRKLPTISNLWTSSRDDCASRCLREHYFSYGVGYRPVVDSEALRFGTLIHAGLEAWWKSQGDRLADALAALDAFKDRSALSPHVFESTKVLMLGYDARWAPEMEHYDVLYVEAKFTAPMLNPETGAASRTWQVGGKLDAIIRVRANGTVMIVEHKTTSEDVSAGSNYWRQLRLNGQIGMYYTGCKAIVGVEASGVVYDVISKPTLRPYMATPVEARKFTQPKLAKHEPCKGKGCEGCDGGKILVEGPRLYAGQRETDETPQEYAQRVAASIAEDPNGYYARAEVVRLEGELTEYQYDVWQRSRMVADLNNMGRAPRNPKSCIRYGSVCSYFAVCCGEAQIDDPTKFRRVTDHPELAEPAEQSVK